MKKVCCRCGAEMGRVRADIFDEAVITHGICDACGEELMFEELGVPLREFLDTLDAPVLVLDADAEVHTANRQACSLLKKTLGEVEGRRGGEVIECKYSRTPGGCGEDIHCKSCTIRKTVLKTHETGKSFERVPAYPDICFGNEIKPVRFEISTEKVGGLVLLRVDDVNPGNEDHQGDRVPFERTPPDDRSS